MQRLIPLVYLLSCAPQTTTTPAPAEPAGDETPAEAEEETVTVEAAPAEEPAPRCRGERRSDWEQQELYRAVAGCVNATISMLDRTDEESLRRYATDVVGMTVEGDDILHEATLRVRGDAPVILEGVEEYARVSSIVYVRIRHPIREGLSPVFADLCSLPCVLSVNVSNARGRLLAE